jgi:methylmalonyl-CoA mutase
MEIAKLRASRLLWAKIVEQYKPVNQESACMDIHVTTSLWNKTIFDPYVNILRTTTETMAASLGGANSITVLPFDITYKKGDDFSNRIARNQQIIIKEESYFNKVADIAGGSYYIENLTDAIADAAWKLFQSIEEKGGLIEQIKNGSIYDELEKTCMQRDMDIAMRKTVMLGTNQHPNQKETMLDKIQPNKDIKDLTTKLKTYRGALAFEALRLATEDYVIQGNKKPIVFLLTIGNLTMRKARAMFSNNLFGCAGYQIIDTNGFKTVEEGVEAAFTANADIVILCSSDDEYAEIAPKACKLIKDKNNNVKVIVAGYPTAIIDQLKNAGIDDFIHIRTNVLETLQKYNQLLGI